MVTHSHSSLLQLLRELLVSTLRESLVGRKRWKVSDKSEHTVRPRACQFWSSDSKLTNLAVALSAS